MLTAFMGGVNATIVVARLMSGTWRPVTWLNLLAAVACFGVLIAVYRMRRGTYGY